jgi:hypothetical protein
VPERRAIPNSKGKKGASERQKISGKAETQMERCDEEAYGEERSTSRGCNGEASDAKNHTFC